MTTEPPSATAFWTVPEWRAAYANGATPEDLLGPLATAAASASASASASPTPSNHEPAWISRIGAEALAARLARLDLQLAEAGGDRSRLPLYGVPLAVKDNIDVAGFETTCACPAYAYRPAGSAEAIERLEAAGAVVVGKTNLDQFATGLVGTRSPHGAVPNAFDARYIAGGSSAGSASVVAQGIVPFALSTDTAGSGRVPAGHNNLVGIKPTRGLVSTRGLVPACRTLDCIGAMALDVNDAAEAVRTMAGYDAADPYSRHAGAAPPAARERPVIGIPSMLEWFGDAAAERVHANALERFALLGAELRPIDFSPLLEAASLLYDGPWLAERFAAIESVMRERPEVVHPVVRGIVEGARRFDAVDAFKGLYRLAELKRTADALIAPLDALLVPTAPTICKIEEALADPVLLNARMGRWTNFVNLLDWCAIALPAGFRADALPAGITLIAPAFHDARLVDLGRRWQAASPWPRGASRMTLPPPGVAAEAVAAAGETMLLAVVGAHLSGMPLNGQLTERGGVRVEAVRTSSAYRLFVLPNTVPPKPGLVRTNEGAPIEMELWAMPVATFGSFVALVPSPLGIGRVALEDGREVQGFVCEAWAAEGARDITALGGWRAYVDTLRPGVSPLG